MTSQIPAPAGIMVTHLRSVNTRQEKSVTITKG